MSTSPVPSVKTCVLNIEPHKLIYGGPDWIRTNDVFSEKDYESSALGHCATGPIQTV